MGVGGSCKERTFNFPYCDDAGYKTTDEQDILGLNCKRKRHVDDKAHNCASGGGQQLAVAWFDGDWEDVIEMTE